MGSLSTRSFLMIRISLMFDILTDHFLICFLNLFWCFFQIKEFASFRADETMLFCMTCGECTLFLLVYSV